MSVVYSGDKITFADSSVQSSAPIGFKNKIINGDCRIDQRNAGASVTPNTSAVVYPVDRFGIGVSQNSKLTAQQNAGSVTPPSGFINYLGVTSSSAYSIVSSDYFLIIQKIEGLNCADLGWGTANAKTVTLSFQVRSSLTGTFGGSLRNSAANRAYPFSYTISSANTWTTISVTIPGDTTGTWLTTNGVGIEVIFSLGTGSTASGTAGSWAGANYVSTTGATSVVGTNGATFYITGVQLEVGSTASAFEVRDYGRELMMCQRYYQQFNFIDALGTAGATALTTTKWSTTDAGICNAPLNCAMRTAPTVSSTSSTVRTIVSSGITTSTIQGFYCNGIGPIMMTWTNNSLSPGYGWADAMGTWKATAEL